MTVHVLCHHQHREPVITIGVMPSLREALAVLPELALEFLERCSPDFREYALGFQVDLVENGEVAYSESIITLAKIALRQRAFGPGCGSCDGCDGGGGKC